MNDPGRYFDADPRPRRSPRLFAEVEDIRGAVPVAAVHASKPTPAQLDRMRREAGIYTLVEAGWTYHMVAKLLGMTPRGVGVAHARVIRRKSRI